MLARILVLLATAVSALQFGAAPVTSAQRAAVSMNTNYGDPLVKAMKKKDPKTGSSLGLKGYTVGSLAPPGSKNSGNKAVFGYGIDNRYGGKAKAKADVPEPPATKLGLPLAAIATLLLVAGAAPN